ncbi:MAG: gliding-motility protein MglA [Acidobacteriota bacterium]|nr:gliding-motility protein MglA [Acidobacteriota bacterium]
MPFINYAQREITCKIVYYGPGLGGKTTNLQWIHQKTNPDAKGKLVSLATESERTLFFDLLPLNLGTIRGFKVRFQLYTVPGQIFYEASRKLIVKGADGVCFVADSQAARYDANLESLKDLRSHLRAHSIDFPSIPYALQLNKRDLPTAMPKDQLIAALRLKNEPVIEAVAVQGIGVFETLKVIVKQTLAQLRTGAAV